MKYLAIDTSGKNLTVVVENCGKVYKYYDDNCGLKHSVTLMPVVEKLLNQSGLNLKDADFIAVVVGAGSFTGIRIGVSTVKALCFAFKKPCLSITSFDVLAYNKSEGRVLAAIDAGHGGYYVCPYDDSVPEKEPSYIIRDELIALAANYMVVAAEELGVVPCYVADMTEGLISAVRAKCGEASSDPDSAVPLYVRKSQAEEGR